MDKKPHFNHVNVVTCKEAAKARKIELVQELKTIVMVCHYKIIAVHICGSNQIYSKAIKKTLDSKQLRFLNLDELKKFNLYPGIVNPWNIGFCESHLICNNVFENEYMATNNGTLSSGVKFKPNELLKLTNIKRGVFSC